jgi:hypothetical protein
MQTSQAAANFNLQSSSSYIAFKLTNSIVQVDAIGTRRHAIMFNWQTNCFLFPVISRYILNGTYKETGFEEAARRKASQKCISHSLPSIPNDRRPLLLSPWTPLPCSHVQFLTSKLATICWWQPNFPFCHYSWELYYCFVNFLLFLSQRSSFCWEEECVCLRLEAHKSKPHSSGIRMIVPFWVSKKLV